MKLPITIPWKNRHTNSNGRTFICKRPDMMSATALKNNRKSLNRLVDTFDSGASRRKELSLCQLLHQVA
jgi:hypothetical protein